MVREIATCKVCFDDFMKRCDTTCFANAED